VQCRVGRGRRHRRRSEAEASIVNRWMAGIAVVDRAACLEGRRTFAKAC
jgi:hypothetical protein